MRECRDAQISIFDFYAQHEQGQRFRRLSELLDQHRDILTLVEQDFDNANLTRTGARGLSIESIFRCLLTKPGTVYSFIQGGRFTFGFKAELNRSYAKTPGLIT